jgi:hypothetical protein
LCGWRFVFARILTRAFYSTFFRHNDLSVCNWLTSDEKNATSPARRIV